MISEKGNRRFIVFRLLVVVYSLQKGGDTNVKDSKL